MKNETSYYPGCHLSSAGKRNPHQFCEHLKETLATRKACENLHKELDRRELRNEKLMKELQSVRNSLNTSQVLLVCHALLTIHISLRTSYGY